MSSTQNESPISHSAAHRRACETAVIHPQALAGLRLFNKGEYFEAHEALELAWRAESSTIRDLYRGILQVAVMYHHIQRQNFRGAVKVFHRCMPWLEPFPTACCGIDIAGLRQNCQAVHAEVSRLGPNGIGNFNQNFLKPVKFFDPDQKE